jgi:hypothetical protein
MNMLVKLFKRARLADIVEGGKRWDRHGESDGKEER